MLWGGGGAQQPRKTQRSITSRLKLATGAVQQFVIIIIIVIIAYNIVHGYSRYSSSILRYKRDVPKRFRKWKNEHESLDRAPPVSPHFAVTTRLVTVKYKRFIAGAIDFVRCIIYMHVITLYCFESPRFVTVRRVGIGEGPG